MTSQRLYGVITAKRSLFTTAVAIGMAIALEHQQPAESATKLVMKQCAYPYSQDPTPEADLAGQEHTELLSRLNAGPAL